MRKVAAFCICTFIITISMFSPSASQESPWKSLHQSVKQTPSALKPGGPSFVSALAPSPVVTAPTTTTTTAPPPPPAPAVTPLQYAEWTKVAICEEGGWIGYAGPAYPDSLGISAANWRAYGGGSDLSPDAQILVAERIQMNPPDQNGCAAW